MNNIIKTAKIFGIKYSTELTSEIEEKEGLLSEVEYSEPEYALNLLDDLIKNTKSDNDRFSLNEIKRQFVEQENYIRSIKDEMLKSFASK